MRAVHVGLFQDFLNDVMHCKIEDDLSFRDVICFEVWRVAHVSICNRPAFMVKNIQKIYRQWQFLKIYKLVHVSRRLSRGKILLVGTS